MDRVTAVGAALTVLSVIGYAVAMVAPYPGRWVTLSGVMVGLALLAVGGAADHDVTGSATADGAGAETPDSGGYTDPAPNGTAHDASGAATGGATGGVATANDDRGGAG